MADMKTIEERAKEYADNFVVGDSAIIVDLLHKVAEESYIKGSTEQKAIDAPKAIKAHCSFCEAHNACVDRGAFHCPETEYIRKAMED